MMLHMQQMIVIEEIHQEYIVLSIPLMEINQIQDYQN